jgi:hypothetical protein
MTLKVFPRCGRQGCQSKFEFLDRLNLPSFFPLHWPTLFLPRVILQGFKFTTSGLPFPGANIHLYKQSCWCIMWSSNRAIRVQDYLRTLRAWFLVRVAGLAPFYRCLYMVENGVSAHATCVSTHAHSVTSLPFIYDVFHIISAS